MKNLRTLLCLYVLVLLSSPLQANIVGSSAQNFNPISNGLDFVTVHSSKTLPPCIFNCGFFVNHAVNSFPFFEQGGVAVQDDSLTSGDFNFGMGITKNWDFGISLPYIFTQSVNVDDPSLVGIYDQSGVTEVRANTKYRFFQGENWGGAAIFTVNFPRIQNDPFDGDGGGPHYTLEFAFDRRFSNVNFALNVGYRYRSQGESLFATTSIDPAPNQFIASTGISYHFDRIDTKLIWEVLAAIPAGEEGRNASEKTYQSIETILGLKYDFSTQVAGHIGGGTELMEGGATPDWRLYAGLNWAFGSECKDEKKVVVKQVYQRDPERKAPPVKAYRKVVLRAINFIYGTNQISPDSQERLKTFIRGLKSLKGVTRLVIEGHTDSVGDEEANKRLGLSRAEAIKNVVVKNTNLTDSMIETVSYGEERPVSTNENYQGRYLNRRVEVKIYDSQSNKVYKTKRLKETNRDFDPSIDGRVDGEQPGNRGSVDSDTSSSLSDEGYEETDSIKEEVEPAFQEPQGSQESNDYIESNETDGDSSSVDSENANDDYEF